MIYGVHKCQEHEFNLDFSLVPATKIHFVPILLLGLNLAIDILKRCLRGDFHQMCSFTDSYFYFNVEVGNVFDYQFIDLTLRLQKIRQFDGKLLVDQEVNNLGPILMRKAFDQVLLYHILVLWVNLRDLFQIRGQLPYDRCVIDVFCLFLELIFIRFREGYHALPQ